MSLDSVTANILDCNFVISKFELQAKFYAHYTLQKGRNLLIALAMGLTVLLLSFYKNGFDMALNKETKQNSCYK